MAKGRFASSGVVVGQTPASRWEKRIQHQKSSKVTMGVGVPRQVEGTVGDITVREVSTLGLRCYIKTNSGWYDINSMQTAFRTVWTPFDLSTGWVTDDTYGELAYFKDEHGFVHLRGGVDTGSAADEIAVLPEGFRPRVDQRRLVNRLIDTGTLYIQIIRIQDSGEINRVAGFKMIASSENVDVDTTAEICLDGISFFAGQVIVSQGGGSGGGGGGGGPPAHGGGGA
jgi:hypothetical protein